MSPPTEKDEPNAAPASDDEPVEPAPKKKKHGWRFWMVFFALCLISFISAVESTIVTIALPTITRAIGGEKQYVWVVNSFVFAATATQPFFGQISDIFGRRNPMLASIILFALGSGIAGGASSIGMLIAGRTIQGLGSGGLFVLLDLIICDLVPLRDRGKYLGFMLSTAAIGTTIGPILGGGLATTDWPWIFYLNLPICGLALIVIIFCLRVKYNRDPSWKSALRRIDYTGNFIFISSITAILLGLVMGGSTHPWSSWRIIVPLVLGAVGWIAFHFHPASSFCKEPSIPPRLFGHPTSFMGFLLGFTSSMLLEWVVYFLPLYFQAVLVPCGMFAGGFMSKTGLYRPLHWAGFALSAIGCGLLSMLDEGSSKAAWVCYQMIAAAGTGIVMSIMLPTALAALPEKDVAAATGTYSFLRSFGFLWGVTLPSIIFNGRFDAHLGDIADVNVRELLKNGAAYGYASGGYVARLPDDIRREVINVYVRALRSVWLAAVAFAVFSFFMVFFMKHVELRKELNTEFGLDESSGKKTKNDTEDKA